MPPGGQSELPLHVLVHNPPCGAAPLRTRLPVSRHVSGPQAASDVHGRPSCAAPGMGPPPEELDDTLLDTVLPLLLDAASLLLDAIDDPTCDDVPAPPVPAIPPVPAGLLVADPQAINKEDAAPRTRRDRSSAA